MMLQLIIIGAGGFGRELHTMLFDAFSPHDFQFKGFLAAESNELAERVGPVLAAPEDYQPEPADRFLLAIGDIGARVRTTQAISDRGGHFMSFVHPTAMVASTAKIGRGAIVYPFATVSNAAVLDEQVHLNYYASAGHDAQIGKHCLLAPYATLNGFCVLEDDVYVSTHATVVAGKRVGTRSKISANSAVMHDVPADSMVFGVPGRVVRKVSL